MPWRKPKKDPWENIEDPVLSGWVPGNRLADMMAMITSLARSQYKLAGAQLRFGRMLNFIAWVLMAVAFINVYYMCRLNGWW
jgi:hypothetical protein